MTPTLHHTITPLFAIWALLCVLARATDRPPLPVKTEHFDHDPGWEGRGNRVELKSPPVVKQDFGYDPAGNNNLGEIKVTLGDESVTLPFKPGRKTEGATFDRFGLFTSQAGGQMVRIFLDDLSYTAAIRKTHQP